MSGQANAVAWMMQHEMEPDEGTVERILAAAKASDHVLTKAEIESLLGVGADS